MRSLDDAAGRLVTDTVKRDLSLSHLMLLDDLYWLAAFSRRVQQVQARWCSG